MVSRRSTQARLARASSTAPAGGRGDRKPPRAGSSRKTPPRRTARQREASPARRPLALRGAKTPDSAPKARPVKIANEPRRTAGLMVRLEIEVDDGAARDDASILLDGRIRRPRGTVAGGFPGVRERDFAARQVARGTNLQTLAELLATVGHPQRLRVLLKLLAGEATHKLLIKATGLKAGPLHYHLRELRMAELIGPKQRDLYSLTQRGRRTILAAVAVGRLCR